MKKYIGLKLIEAKPMSQDQHAGAVNKGDLSKLSGGVDQDGYRVVDQDGYTSWSPKDVLEKAYKKTKVLNELGKTEIDYGFQERVWDEAEELEVKVEALNIFININNDVFLSLTKEEQDRLKQQLLAMQYYLTILVERIENFK